MSLGELYGFVVYDCSIAPDYFLDMMSQDEVSYLAKSYIKGYREKWEMLRMNMHATISSQSSKAIKSTDIMKFAWDDSDSKKEVTAEDVEEARERIRKKFNLHNKE